MNRATAELLTFATIPIWLFTIAYTFVAGEWHFLPSFLLACLLVAPLLCAAILVEHRSASIENRPPRSFFPSKIGFYSFLFVTTLCALLVGCFVAVKAVALRIPGGDDWLGASTRLLFCVVALLIAFLLYQAVAWVTRRWLEGRIYQNWLSSLDEPVTLERIRRELDDRFTTMILFTIFVLGIVVCFFGLEWIGDVQDIDFDRASRMRKLKAKIRWLIEHPNTVRLFTGFIAACAGMLLAWKTLTREPDSDEESLR